MKSLLILGATGQVGQQILQLALQHPEISRIVAPTRRPLAQHDKLDNPIVDFEQLPEDAPWWKADLAICALGTTLRQAKSRAGFYRVDHDYVLAAASLIHRAGTPVFGLVSSLGASPSSRVFYLKTSGESLFLRKLVLGIPAQASGKNLTRLLCLRRPDSSSSPRPDPTGGRNIGSK